MPSLRLHLGKLYFTGIWSLKDKYTHQQHYYFIINSRQGHVSPGRCQSDTKAAFRMQKLKAPLLRPHFNKIPLKLVRSHVTAGAEPPPASWETRALNTVYKPTLLIFAQCKRIWSIHSHFFSISAAAKVQTTVPHAKTAQSIPTGINSEALKKPWYDHIAPLSLPHRHKDAT